MRDDVILQISNLSKSFGPVRALKGVDFELRKGEIHPIAGENGAGKSTTFKNLTCEIEPTAGKIHIESIDVNRDFNKILGAFGDAQA